MPKSMIASPTILKFSFRHLPMELRLECWEAALRQQAQSYLVFVDLPDGRVWPTRQLCSALLSVNCESRRCSLKFFPTRLPVLRLVFVTSFAGSPSTRCNVEERGALYLNFESSLFVQSDMKDWFQRKRYDIPGHPDHRTTYSITLSKITQENECARVKRLSALQKFNIHQPYGRRED
ncbi:putative 2EXR domain-containing protein [Seiridium cardinale]|uniref:2EXR domain-containing protein n=1 Tax=Seiridium cardinale TaxID=138064 RepID=A0ABR2XMW3_9PEZI